MNFVRDTKSPARSYTFKDKMTTQNGKNNTKCLKVHLFRTRGQVISEGLLKEFHEESLKQIQEEYPKEEYRRNQR